MRRDNTRSRGYSSGKRACAVRSSTPSNPPPPNAILCRLREQTPDNCNHNALWPFARRYFVRTYLAIYVPTGRIKLKRSSRHYNEEHSANPLPLLMTRSTDKFSAFSSYVRTYARNRINVVAHVYGRILLNWKIHVLFYDASERAGADVRSQSGARARKMALRDTARYLLFLYITPRIPDRFLRPLPSFLPLSV